MKKRFLFIACVLVFTTGLHAQDTAIDTADLIIQEMSFTNQSIQDILMALAAVSGRSIVPDQTVQGQASYYFTGIEFDKALKLFLEQNGYYYTKEEGIYYVSRILSQWDEESGLLSVHAEEVDLKQLLNHISRKIDKTILFDSLPMERISVHAKSMTPLQVLEVALARFSDEYELQDKNHFYQISRLAGEGSPGSSRRRGTEVLKDESGYSLEIHNVYYQDLIQKLFLQEGREYSLFNKKNPLIPYLSFRNKSFEQMLRLILEQIGADYSIHDEIYYLFDIDQRETLKKLNTTVHIPLESITVDMLNNLMPTGLANSKYYKADKLTNSVILNGSVEEIEPVLSFIRSVDVPTEGKSYVLFEPDFIRADDLSGMLPPSLQFSNMIPLADRNAFIILLSPSQEVLFRNYLNTIDKPKLISPVKLRYIHSEDLMKRLPPSISSDDVVETGDPRLVFFKGTDAQKLAFLKDLAVIDNPVPQIRYHFMIVMYQEGKSLTYDPGLSVTPGWDDHSFIGNIGSLLSVNFDVVNTLGYQMAMKLNLDLNNNNARVVADTVLIGTTGDEVDFQNTETYRYRELEVNDEGIIDRTGVAQEITSGLFFKVKGWVSGDGMISMDVKATVSKQGENDSENLGSLPPTTENIVNTRVRTEIGTPVVIGGLIRQDSEEIVSKVPVLGHIPLLGKLFQSRQKKMTNSEIVIYLVPHVDYGISPEQEPQARMNQIFKRLIEKQ